MKALQSDDVYDEIHGDKLSKNQRKRMNKKQDELTAEQTRVVRFYKGYFEKNKDTQPIADLMDKSINALKRL